MPFSLYNTPATFQYFINDILREYLNIFISAYINNLLIYSKTLKEYKEYIRKILNILRKNSLQMNIKKYEFHIEEVLYLGIIIGRHSIKIDPAKVITIKKWAKQENIKDV